MNHLSCFFVDKAFFIEGISEGILLQHFISNMDKAELKKEKKDLSIKSVIERAYSKKLIKQTETYKNIIERNFDFLEQLKSDNFYEKFKKQYLSGKIRLIK